MKVIVDRIDLLPEHEDVSCSQTSFEHFKPEIQQVIALAGKATFREFDGSSYNVVHAPVNGPTWVGQDSSGYPYHLGQ